MSRIELVRPCSWLWLESASPCALDNNTPTPTAAYNNNPGQRHLIWCGAAYRLATVAPVPLLTYVAPSLGYELDGLVQKLDNQGHQSQKSVQPIHRQTTSPHKRRGYRLAELI